MKYVIAVALLLATLSGADGQGFEEVEFRARASFTELRFGMNEYTAGIDHFVMLNRSEMLIWDKFVGMLRRVRLSGEIVNEMPLTSPFGGDSNYTMRRTGSWLTIDQFIGTFIVVDCTSGRALELKFADHGLSSWSTDFNALLESSLLVYQRADDQSYHTFQIIETETGLDYIYRDPRETRAYVEERYEGRDEFWFDGEFLMYGERLVTASGKTFGRYFGLGDRLDVHRELTRGDATFMGVDSGGNYYWNRGNFVMIFDRHGQELLYLRYDPPENKGRPQIDPDGNIYILSYGGITPGQLDLLWIERDW